MIDLKVAILAAGEGRRYRPLAQTRSKVVRPVDNRPFMEHVILALAESNRTLAKENFSKALCQGDSSLRAKAMLGLIRSYCGIGLERLAELHDKRNPEDQ